MKILVLTPCSASVRSTCLSGQTGWRPSKKRNKGTPWCKNKYISNCWFQQNSRLSESSFKYVSKTCLKCFRQLGPKGLWHEGGGDGAGEADQHHDHVRDLNKIYSCKQPLLLLLLLLSLSSVGSSQLDHHHDHIRDLNGGYFRKLPLVFLLLLLSVASSQADQHHDGIWIGGARSIPLWNRSSLEQQHHFHVRDLNGS